MRGKEREDGREKEMKLERKGKGREDMKKQMKGKETEGEERKGTE